MPEKNGTVITRDKLDGEIVTSPHGRLVLVYNPDTEKGCVPENMLAERYAINWDDFNGLSGRLLTIADAAFADAEQRKAAKDLIRNAIREWAEDVSTYCWNDLPNEMREKLGIPLQPA